MPSDELGFRFDKPLSQIIGPFLPVHAQGVLAEQSILFPENVAPRARPWIIRRVLNHVCSDGIQLDIPHRPIEVGIVHRIGEIPPLPEESYPSMAPVNCLCIGLVGLAESRGQACRPERHGDEMDMVVHQAIGPYGQAGDVPPLLQKAEIVGFVIVREENVLAAIAALHDVMGNPGNDDSSGSRHLI